MSTLTEERMLKLMAYVDGELEGDERAGVEAWLASDVDAARFANELAGLGDLVRMGHGASCAAKSVASFDIADAVMAAVKEDKPSAGTDHAQARSGATSLDQARARRQKYLRSATAVAATLALAASIFVMVRQKDEQPLARGPAAIVQPPTLASAEPGVDVDVVETAGDSVRVFYLANESSLTTSVVVWVDESGGK